AGISAAAGVIGVLTSWRHPADGRQTTARDVVEELGLRRDDVLLPIGTVVDVLDGLVRAPYASAAADRRSVKAPRDACRIQFVAQRLVVEAGSDVPADGA